jgi:hypothetical protein
MIVRPYETAPFAPVIPERPEGPSIAVLSGDPDSGPSDMLLRMPRGAGRLHIHRSNYRLVVIEGRMQHWPADGAQADAPVLGPGSYWFQPGGEAHADACLSETCLMFIRWAGPRDARLAD